MRHACLALLLALAEAREFEFVSAERAGSRRSCGGAHYVPGTHSGELHAKALERRQREREEQALLEPSFLETAMVPPAMQMPPPYFLNPWLYASMMAYPGLHPVAMRSPPGLKATASITSSCPLRTWSSLPFLESQIRAMASSEPVTRMESSGL